jgi:hypothetical protein
MSTQKDGDCCMFSINCLAGSICNDPTEDLYVASKPNQICVKVVCATDGDCDTSMGQKCSLQKVCSQPTCQIDSECAGGMSCIGGACSALPSASNVMTCEIATRNTVLRQGQSIPLVAVAKNANGVVQSHIGFDWSSSNTNAVSVSGAMATGGSAQDIAMLTAKVTGNSAVSCTGLSITNFPTLAANMSRVVLVSDDDGSPITGAQVTLQSGMNSMMAMSDMTTGAATFASGAAIDAITVTKAGLQSISVLAPGTNDIFLPVPRVPNETVAGGFRGSIDISATKHADIQLGIAGPSIPNNLLDFGLTSLLGDSVKTVIDAPELGLNMQNLNLPGGVMLALGNKEFTNDATMTGGGTRCQNMAPGSTQLGCYVARAPAGHGAGWVLAGQLKLSQVTAIATQLSNAFGGGKSTNSVPIGDILTAVLPLVSTLYHGADASITTTEYPKVPADKTMQVDCTNPSNASDDTKCVADYSKYQVINSNPMSFAADTKLSVLSTVNVPTLPNLPKATGCAGAAILVTGAILPGRGLLPLGLSAGLDVLHMDTADCKIDGVDKPFGDNSPKLMDGQMPLSMSPPHAGLEGSKLFMLLLSLDPKTISGSNIQLTALVKRKDSVSQAESFSDQTYLGFPTGTLAKAAGTFTLAGAVAGANVVRLQIENGADTWLVYAPSSMTTITTPNVAAARGVLSGSTKSFVQAIQLEGNYNDVWTLGSGKTLDHFVDNVDAFVVQQCDTAATAACVVQ